MGTVPFHLPPPDSPGPEGFPPAPPPPISVFTKRTAETSHPRLDLTEGLWDSRSEALSAGLALARFGPGAGPCRGSWDLWTQKWWPGAKASLQRLSSWVEHLAFPQAASS